MLTLTLDCKNVKAIFFLSRELFFYMGFLVWIDMGTNCSIIGGDIQSQGGLLLHL